MDYDILVERHKGHGQCMYGGDQWPGVHPHTAHTNKITSFLSYYRPHDRLLKPDVLTLCAEHTVQYTSYFEDYLGKLNWPDKKIIIVHKH